MHVDAGGEAWSRRRCACFSSRLHTTPADWTEGKPGAGPIIPSKPIVKRFERPYGATTAPSATASGDAPAPITLQAPPRTIGSKIPINRRHKRQR